MKKSSGMKFINSSVYQHHSANELDCSQSTFSLLDVRSSSAATSLTGRVIKLTAALLVELLFKEILL